MENKKNPESGSDATFLNKGRGVYVAPPVASSAPEAGVAFFFL